MAAQKNDLSFYAVGSHSQVVADTATPLTPPGTNLDASGIIMQANGAVRYTLDGSSPTTSKGFRFTATDGPIRVDVMGGSRIRVINEVAGTIIDYQFIGSY